MSEPNALRNALPYIVGLTGGIGCGKTTVSDVFAEHGVAVVDTDLIAHALTGPQGQAMPAIVAAFGEGICRFDGGLDRAVMRQRVFADPALRQQLEAILHPMIFSAAMSACADVDPHTSPYVLLVVPLLVEAGQKYRAICQQIVVIECDEETQIARVMARNNLTRSAVEAMLAAQTTQMARRDVATEILRNEGDVQSLREHVLALHEKFQQLARQTHCFS